MPLYYAIRQRKRALLVVGDIMTRALIFQLKILILAIRDKRQH